MQNPHHFDAAAPSWDSSAYRVYRAERIAQCIARLAPENLTGRVLDFGCGTGLLGFHFVEQAAHTDFADTSAGMLAQVEQKAAGNARVGTILLGEQNYEKPYDLIVTLMALHHIEDHAAAIAGLVRQLSAGGRIYLCDLDTEDGSFHGETKVPHNGFDRVEIARILRDLGLAEVTVCTGHTDERNVAEIHKQYPIFVVGGRKP